MLGVFAEQGGNGRVSRLLTLLALYQHGYEVGRYVSLERLVEEAKEDYYRVLQQSSQRWHDGKHELLPWLNHFIAIARRAYGEFEQRAGEGFGVNSPTSPRPGVLAKTAPHEPPFIFGQNDPESAQFCQK